MESYEKRVERLHDEALKMKKDFPDKYFILITKSDSNDGDIHIKQTFHCSVLFLIRVVDFLKNVISKNN